MTICSRPVRRVAEALRRAGEDLADGQRRERRLLRGLPDHGIAADQRQGRVPGEGGDGEVEGGDDSADAQGMPGLAHGMARPLRGDGEAIELARETDGEIADVDHLLHLAQPFLQDLAAFQGHQPAEALLRRAQLLAEEPHQLAPARCRHLAPGAEGHDALGDHGLDLRGAMGLELGDGAAVDGRMDGEAAAADLGGGQAARGKNVAMGHKSLLRDRAMCLQRMGIGPPGPPSTCAGLGRSRQMQPEPQQGGGQRQEGDRVDGVPGQKAARRRRRFHRPET